MRIAPLDKDTVKLINTTQVITSVSTAVKELLENALDANAKNIDITLSNTGSSLIQIKDDGSGISKEDAEFMALPSYTSKIINFSDLETLQTYGFRGEALTSLCAVADVWVTTKTNEEDIATTYILDQCGRISKSFSCHRSTGTTVQVKDLFKRMPVRRQLITNAKKGMQEIKVLESLLKSYAICRYYVRINCRVDGSIVFSKPASSSLKESAGYVFGKRAMDNMAWLDIEDTEITIQVMVPSRGTTVISDVLHSSGQYIFVNGRPIQHKQLDKLMTKTILEGLAQETGSKRRPMYILHILMDPADIDVNLEPNKVSVFFKNQDCVLQAIESRLRTFYGILCEESQSNDVPNTSNSYLDNTRGNENELLEGTPSKRRRLNHDSGIFQNIPAKDNEIDGDHTEVPITCSTRNSDAGNGVEQKVIVTGSLNLSETGSEDSVHLKLSPGSPESIPQAGNKSRETRNHSPLFELSQRNGSDVLETETLSQLPVVDLGDDFDWNISDQAGQSNNTMEDSGAEEIKNLSKPVLKQTTLFGRSEGTTLESWSKGHVSGLKGGTNIESYVESYVRASQEDDTLNESSSQMQKVLLANNPCAGLLKFLKEITPQVSKENPGLSIPQIVQKIITQWKSLPVEERGYYRDMARPTTQKPSKAETSSIDLKINKTRLLNMLDKMKRSNVDKKENLILRTTAPWLIDINKIRHNFQKKNSGDAVLVVGKLMPNMWLINHSAYLWAVDIGNIKKEMNVSDTPMDQCRDENLEALLKKFLMEKDDLSSLHPVCPLDQN